MTPAGDNAAPPPRGRPDTLPTALSAGAFRRRLNAKILAEVAVAPSWVAAALFATWRLAVGRGSLLVGVLAISLGALGILRRFVKEAWTEEQAAILLDRAAGAGGLLLALRELPGGQHRADWLATLATRLQTTRPPEVQVGRPLLASAAAILFAVVAALLPEAKAPFSRLQAAAAARVEEAEVKAEILAAEEKVPDAIQQELERLKAEAESGKFDASDWEAADAVQQALEHAAAERQGELAGAEAAAQQLASALDSNAAGESEARAREDLEQALMDLEEGASGQSGGEKQGEGQQANGQEGEQKPGDKGAGKEGEKEGQQADGKEKPGDEGKSSKEGAGKEKPGEQGKSSKDGKPSKSSKAVKSPADARSLARALEQRRQALENGFPQSKGQQASNGSGKSRGDPSNYPKGKGAGADGSGKGVEKGEAGEGLQSGGGPGPGGGVAPLIFGEEVQMQTERLDLEALPESDDPEPGELLGLKAKNPRKDGAAITAPGAASGGGPDGVAPHGGTVAPRHRELLKKYFDHQKGTPQ